MKSTQALRLLALAVLLALASAQGARRAMSDGLKQDRE